MGIIQHHAVLATTWDDRSAARLAKWIDVQAPEVAARFVRSESPVNGDTTFILPPDGSKEGWEDSNDGDALRTRFISELERIGRFAWVEVEWGEVGYRISRSDQSLSVEDRR